MVKSVKNQKMLENAALVSGYKLPNTSFFQGSMVDN